MRIVITPYSVLAFVLVVAVAAGLAAGAHRLVWWARRMVAASPLAGTAGVVLTAAAAVNVAVPRTCADGVHNRPIVSALVGDPCRPAGLAQVALVVIVGAAATAVVRLLAVRRGADHREAPVP